MTRSIATTETESISSSNPSTTRADVIAVDWERVQLDAKIDLVIDLAVARASDFRARASLRALHPPIFSEPERAEFLERSVLAAALNALALDAQRRHPAPFHRWLDELRREAHRREHYNAETAYSLRSIARAVGLEKWVPGFGIDGWAA